MGLSNWIIIIGTALFLKKGITNTTTEREQSETKKQRIEKQHKNASTESLRKSSVNDKRKNTPCFFKDGISNEDFSYLANKIGNKLKRIKKVSINGAVISCTVESQTGYSDWKFTVDFNDWGHITGTRWTWTENTDSNIPNHYGSMMTSAIYQLLSDRNIHLEDYSDAVDENITLETERGLEFNKKYGFFKKLLTKEKEIICQYDWLSLKGEHLYPVISFLKSNGFCNVKSIAIKDVGCNSKNYLFEVEQIVINGSSFFKVGDIFNKSSEVVITYHEKQEIIMPFAEGHFKKRNYIDVGDELEALGFSSIYECPIKDLTTGWVKKDGSVEKITVLGNRLKEKAVYKYDDKIVIEYHTYKTKSKQTE